MKTTILLATFLLGITSFAQTTQQLKTAAAAFPPMPHSSIDLNPYVTGPATFGSGTPYSDLEYTIINTDYIDGENGGSDTFLPVNPSDALPGSNSVKVIRCILNTDLNDNYQSANRDRIILGTSEIGSPFFLKGSDGIDNDFVSILHFDYRNGSIQLKGQSTDYRLIYCDSTDGSQTDGWFLFYVANNDIDLIAFIFPCDYLEPGISGNPPNNSNPLCNASSTLSLTNPVQFTYASTLSATPAIPQAIAQVGTNGKEIISGMTTDSDNNTYLLGHTDGDISGNNASKSKVFVSKVAPNGTQLWNIDLSQKQGALLMDGVTDNQYLYVCGRTLGNLTGFSNAGRWDGILLKIDKMTGQIVATNQWGNEGIDGYGNIELDGAGNFFISGQGSPAGNSGTNAVYLVAKHSCSDLSNVWRTLNVTAQTGFSASAEAWGGLTFLPSAGTTNGQGRLIVAGWVMAAGGANAFASVYENLHLSTPTRPYSIVLASGGGQRADWILDNAVDSAGNIYFSGYTTGNLQGIHQGEGDAFVVKYSPQLTNPIFRQFGTNKSESIRKMEIKDNILYATGYTYGNYSGNNADNTLNTADIFVQKLDLNLNLLVAKQFGTPHEDRAFAKIQGDNLFIGGMTEGTIISSSNGSFDGFVLALNIADLSYNTNPTLSINNNFLNAEINFYPNPTYDQVIFEIPNSKSFNYILSNQVGQNLSNGILTTQNKSISLSRFSQGIYFISLTEGQSVKTFKIIKQ